MFETRCGVRLSGHDIFLNIAGGIRINEPAADMAVAAALISALSQEPLPAEAIFFGEIGLAGEIRQVAQSDLRLKEASKLGFKDAIVPVIKNKKDGKGRGQAARGEQWRFPQRERGAEPLDPGGVAPWFRADHPGVSFQGVAQRLVYCPDMSGPHAPGALNHHVNVDIRAPPLRDPRDHRDRVQ